MNECNECLYIFEDEVNIPNSNSHACIDSFNNNSIITKDYSNYGDSHYTNHDIFSDLLSENELSILNDIFINDNEVIENNIYSDDSKSNDTVDIITKKRKICEELYLSNKLTSMRLSLSNFRNALKNFFLSNNIDELSKVAYEMMDCKCLVRFKLTNISARTGPKSAIDFFYLKKKAFPDIHPSTTAKYKEFIADRFFVFKSKALLYGTETTYDNTFEFFSQSFNIDDILYLYERKNNFIPNQYCMQIICTRYFDKFTNKIVLCDIGLRIKSQKAIVFNE